MVVFNGDISQISELQLNYIKSVIEKLNFSDVKVTVQPVGKPGDNYIANVKRLIIEEDGQVKMKMIAKIAPTTPELRMMANSGYLFANEHVIYTEILPKFTELEKTVDIPEDDRLRYPICYGSTMESCNEVILLEDLDISGFVMLDRFKPLADDDVKLILKNLAILHSLSYVLKDKEPEKFDSFRSKLHNVWEFMSVTMGGLFVQVENEITALVDQQKHKDALKGFMKKVGEAMIKLNKEDENSKYSVVQQGDAWINNMMFRQEDGKSTKCCMIDYQQSRINSPVADLVYMLFANTDYESRCRHYREWIDYYYSQLELKLNNFGLKSSYVYPRDQLDADLKRHGKVSLGQAVLLASMMARQSAAAAKLKELLEQGAAPEEILKHLGTSSMGEEAMIKFKAKIEGLIDSHIELGYI